MKWNFLQFGNNLTFTEIVFSATEKALYNNFPQLYRNLYFMYKRISERDELYLINSHIKEGMRVVDVGANIGFYTQLFSNLTGASGEVHSFEPDPNNFCKMSKAFSGYRNVYLNQLAVGKRSGEIYLYLSKYLNVDHKTYDSGEDRNKILVQCTSLDDYFSNNEEIDFIKMDIQGYEYQALIGMSRLLDNNKKVRLLFEYYKPGAEELGYSWETLRDFLIEKGFKLYNILSSGKLVPIMEEPVLSKMGYTNVFARRV